MPSMWVCAVVAAMVAAPAVGDPLAGQILKFNMNDIYQGKVPDPRVKRGDVIVVPRRWIL